MEKEVLYYKTSYGREPFSDWLFSLSDHVLVHRIRTRIDRVKQGNYGDHKRFHGIIELRMDFGKGYRLYCAEDGLTIIIFLAGGDKGSQHKNIKEALEY